MKRKLSNFCRDLIAIHPVPEEMMILPVVLCFSHEQIEKEKVETVFMYCLPKTQI